MLPTKARERELARERAVAKGYAGLDNICERTLASEFPYLYCLDETFCSAWDGCLEALQSGTVPVPKRGPSDTPDTPTGKAVVVVYKSKRGSHIRKVFHSAEEAGKELERLHKRRREANAFWNDVDESRFGAVVRDKTQRPMWRYYHGDQPQS